MSRLKLTRNDFEKYGYTKDCPKCADTDAHRPFTGKKHTEICRYRIYSEFERCNDPKHRRVREELGVDDKPHEMPPRDQIDATAPEFQEILPDKAGKGKSKTVSAEPPTPMPAPPSPAPSYAPTTPADVDLVEASERMEIENAELERQMNDSGAPGMEWEDGRGPYDLDMMPEDGDAKWSRQ